MDDYRAAARADAIAVGIDPDRFERQIDQESGFNPNAFNDGSGAVGIAQIVARFHPNVNPWDPMASLVYAASLMRNHLATWDGDWARALSAYNAGPGATASGVKGKLPGWPYAETVRYVSAILQISQSEAARRLTGATPMSPLVFNADEPTVLQPDSWSCAPSALTWGLRALGRHPAQNWVADTMVTQGYESRELGLLDGSGKGMAQFVNEEYGSGDGGPAIHAVYNSNVGYDDVRSVAGSNPVLIGGHHWGDAGHWVGVRRYDPDQGLLLANPGGTGPVYGQQVLDRQAFDARGPWSLVMLSPTDATTPVIPPPTPPAPVDELAALRAENERLRTVIGYASHDIGAALDKEVASIRASLGALDAAINTLKGQG